MDALTPTSLVHFYDVRLHRIPCGVRGFEQRSTKHPRAVTCHACVALIGKRPDTFAASAAGAPAEGATP